MITSTASLLARGLTFAAAACLILPAAASAQSRSAEHWVATWATASVPRVPPAAPAANVAPQFPAQTPAQAQAQGQPAGRGRGAARPFSPNNQTIRQIVHTTLGGTRYRVVLSNLYGTAPLRIGGAHLAIRERNAAIVPGSDRELTFSGSPTVTLPVGADMTSDPVSLTAGNYSDLAIDLFLPDEAGKTTMTIHPSAFETSYASAAGNHAGDSDFPSPATFTSWFFLSRVEVGAPDHTPVIVATGDSITDGTNSTVDANRRWPDVFARRLLPTARGRRIAIVNSAIAGNRLLTQAPGSFGINLLARLDHDVLTQPGAEYVVLLEAINDIGMARQGPGPSVDELIGAHRQVIARAHAMGLKILASTLTPYEGAAYFTDAGEAKRAAFNEWMRTQKEYDGVIDFDAVVRDPQHPARLLPAFDSGDHLHPGDAGYDAMGNAVNLTFFK